MIFYFVLFLLGFKIVVGRDFRVKGISNVVVVLVFVCRRFLVGGF